jgi:hypothetical protein
MRLAEVESADNVGPEISDQDGSNHVDGPIQKGEQIATKPT